MHSNNDSYQQHYPEDDESGLELNIVIDDAEEDAPNFAEVSFNVTLGKKEGTTMKSSNRDLGGDDQTSTNSGFL